MVMFIWFHEKSQEFLILMSFCLPLTSLGSHVDPTALPQTADPPQTLTNGNHAAPSITQPPLNQSGPGRPSVTGMLTLETTARKIPLSNLLLNPGYIHVSGHAIWVFRRVSVVRV